MATAEPAGRLSTSLAARSCNSAPYSTTGGQTVAAAGSEPPVPQPPDKLAAITRTTRRRLQHFPLNVIGLFRCFEALSQPAEPLAGAAAGEEEQEDRGHSQCEAQRAAEKAAATEGGEKAGDHRRPRFQSSSRA